MIQISMHEKGVMKPYTDITGNDGHNTLAVIVAGLKSANTGHWEKVDYCIINLEIRY